MTAPAQDKLQLLAIVTQKNGVLISQPRDSYPYYRSFLEPVRFDGEKAKDTYNKEWKHLNQLPKEVTQVIPEKHVNKKLVLKNGVTPSDEFPATLEYFRNYDEDHEHYSIRGVYDETFDIEPEHIVKLEFDLNVIAEREEFVFVEIDSSWSPRPALVRSIVTPVVLHQELPCSLTIDQTYKIVREWVKRHIDHDYAKVTSDYDFCFTVTKRVKLAKTEEYMIDKNFLTKRKQKLEKRYRNEREVAVFEMCPAKVYSGYTPITAFEGKNHKDLQKKVNKYLKDLMLMINAPVKDCPHCDGSGVTWETKDNG